MSLIGSLDSGTSALESYTQGLNVIGNNIANINTTAFKSATTSYADSFSNTLQAASAESDTNSMQVGTGVQVAGINTDFTQGSLLSTGVITNLAISGNGYFVVQVDLVWQTTTLRGRALAATTAEMASSTVGSLATSSRKITQSGAALPR